MRLIAKRTIKQSNGKRILKGEAVTLTPFGLIGGVEIAEVKTTDGRTLRTTRSLINKYFK